MAGNSLANPSIPVRSVARFSFETRNFGSNVFFLPFFARRTFEKWMHAWKRATIRFDNPDVSTCLDETIFRISRGGGGIRLAREDIVEYFGAPP